MSTVLSLRNPGLEALSNDLYAHQKQVTESSSLEHGSTGVRSKNRNELKILPYSADPSPPTDGKARYKGAVN